MLILQASAYKYSTIQCIKEKRKTYFNTELATKLKHNLMRRILLGGPIIKASSDLLIKSGLLWRRKYYFISNKKWD